MQIEQLKPIVEAALLASTQPVTVQQLGELFTEADAVDRSQIAMALEELAGDCTGRGVELREVASGFRYQVRQEVHPWISRMWTERPSRYSRALLETLALIAYRQPITRPEIEQIRGVVVSSNMIKTMEEREWIRIVGYRDMPGKPALFGTTRAFLDYFNLKSLDQLPPLSAIRDMEDPQLRLEQPALPAYVARDLPIDPDADSAPDAVLADEVHATAPDAADAPTANPTADRHAPTPASTDPTAIADTLGDVQVQTLHVTADEAANPAADVDPDSAEPDTEEYRA
ncbi:MAG TPA: SMC-Scp complex subunit ScpB [Rhodanobacter sp.]|nr:SMC-Scp complex subunit ScpB [Rhodanobacter sp.]